MQDTKRAYPLPYRIPKQGCSYHRWPKERNTKGEDTPYLGASILTFCSLLEFCFGRSYSV